MSADDEFSTVGEWEDELRRTGRYDAVMEERRKRERALALKHEALREAEQPLITALQDHGVTVSSIWDLAGGADDKHAVLDLLIEHLQRPYPDEIREGIARALAVPEARSAWDFLVREYELSRTDSLAKDGLAAALSAASTDADIDTLISLASDPTMGESRLLLLLGVNKSRTARATRALETFAEDAYLGREATAMLRKRQRRRRNA